jgi:hypothetical protein
VTEPVPLRLDAPDGAYDARTEGRQSSAPRLLRDTFMLTIGNMNSVAHEQTPCAFVEAHAASGRHHSVVRHTAIFS